MRAYRERLGAPASWWLAAFGCILLLGTPLWAGLSLFVAGAIYLVLGVASAATLLIWGGTIVQVREAELLAGARRLPLRQAGQVSALDREQTRALRGPRADPAAYLISRPYLAESVYVEVAGRPPGCPYWLVGTRHPAELAAAIEAARPSAGASTPWHDVAGDHAATAGATGPAGEPSGGKDGNAW
jgi:hypothetical protein